MRRSSGRGSSRRIAPGGQASVKQTRPGHACKRLVRGRLGCMRFHRTGTPMTTPRLAAVALVWAGAACAVSQQQEVQLGAETAAQVEQQLPLVRDGQVNSYITSLGRSLARVADTRGLTWHFKVVDSKEVNAFAIPGGWVYVNRGDRKSTRLNSSHLVISYAVFCLK